MSLDLTPINAADSNIDNDVTLVYETSSQQPRGGRPRKIISSPHSPIFKDFLALFGLDNWDDTSVWSQKDLVDGDAINRYFALRPQLLQLSYPRNDVRKIRLDNPTMFNARDLITVLQQFSRLYGYVVNSYTKEIKPNKANGLVRKHCQQIYNLSKMTESQERVETQ